jgi:hypothetical protein
MLPEELHATNALEQAADFHARELSNSGSSKDDSQDVGGADYTVDFCKTQLTDNLLQRYKINVPGGADVDKCDMCTISFEIIIYDGEAWLGIAFSDDGKMIDSEAVM